MSYESQKMLQDYSSGMAVRKVAKKYNIHTRVVKREVLNAGLKYRFAKVYSIDENYFNEIDSPTKAYYLGLIFADGSMVKYRLTDEKPSKMSISLVSDDSYLLEALKKDLNFEGKLQEFRKIPHQTAKSLTITNKKIVNALLKAGVNYKKTYKGERPNITDDLFPYFLLGFMDGDGSFRINGDYIVSYSMTSCIEHLEYIKEKLASLDISTCFFKHKNANAYCLTISGSVSCYKLFRILYSNADKLSVFLERKRKKALEFFHKHGIDLKVKYKMPEKTRKKNMLKWCLKNNLELEESDFERLQVFEIEEKKKWLETLKRGGLKTSNAKIKALEKEIEETKMHSQNSEIFRAANR